jgi:hypothetical protein
MTRPTLHSAPTTVLAREMHRCSDMAEPVDREAVVERLRQIAAYLRLEKDPYRVARAFERGAAVIEARCTWRGARGSCARTC